jgi:hypothetical protein
MMAVSCRNEELQGRREDVGNDTVTPAALIHAPAPVHLA